MGVHRRNDRVMSIKLCFDDNLNVVCAYAPQVGCGEEEKEEFWKQLEEEPSLMPDRERVILSGDLNGHVGRKRDGVERIHGGCGIGEKNAEGERVMGYAMAFDLWQMAFATLYFRRKTTNL